MKYERTFIQDSHYVNKFRKTQEENCGIEFLRTPAFLTDLPVLQMTSMVLAQPSLLGEMNIKAGHDCENWALMSILNHNLAILCSPFGRLPSAV